MLADLIKELEALADTVEDFLANVKVMSPGIVPDHERKSDGYTSILTYNDYKELQQHITNIQNKWETI